jgi:tetratricopeptide (TPR) repeat protein
MEILPLQAYSLLMLERYEEALEIYNKILYIDSEKTSALYYKAYILNELEQYEKALSISRKCYALLPNNIDCIEELAYSLSSL